MDTSYLPSTPERAAILESALMKDGPIGVSAVSRESRASKGLVSRYLSLLENEGVLARKGTKFLVRDGCKARALRLLLAVSGLGGSVFKSPLIESAGLYGSCAKGENTESSDIDLWVRVKGASQADLALLSARIRKKFPRANVLFLTKEKIDRLKKDDPIFYYSLHFGSIRICGETGV